MSDHFHKFLADYEALRSEDEFKTFSQNFTNNNELRQFIYRFLHRDHGIADDEGTLKTLCQFFLQLYRSTLSYRVTAKSNFIPTSTANDMLKTRVLVLQYIPHFIYLYLLMRRKDDHRGRFKCVDAFLLAIYNAEAVEQQRASTTTVANMPSNSLQPCRAVKVPSLATSSTYHDSTRLEGEDKLDQRPSGLVFQFECWSFVDKLTVSSRPRVFRLLLQTFNRHIVEISKPGLDQFVRSTLILLERGYSSQQQRIPLDTPVLLELLFSAYVCMYNGFQV